MIPEFKVGEEGLMLSAKEMNSRIIRPVNQLLNMRAKWPLGITWAEAGLVIGNLLDQNKPLDPLRAPPIQTCIPRDFGLVTPIITAGTWADWITDEVPAGNYVVRYVQGAMKYNPAQGWRVNAIALDKRYSIGIFYPGDVTPTLTKDATPLNYTEYATQAEVEAANAGAEVTIDKATYFDALGENRARIRIRLEDNPYDDNIAGSPNPTFRLLRVCP